MTEDMQPLILVADDEADIRGLLRILLEKEGWRVAEAVDGASAVQAVRAHGAEVSLILLDIMMPGMDGIEAAAEIRRLTDVPILFLTARSSDADKQDAYANGGDDYITKPFHAVDLKLKVRAMLNRYRLYRKRLTDSGNGTDRKGILFPGDIVWNPDGNEVFRGEEKVLLTDREYALFACLGRNRGQNLTPAQLYEEVWGEPYLTTASNTVIVHIANLRRKLEKDPASPSLIRTVWGKGYRID